ncbi:MAG TPA: mechanosensitive ion channel family protein [Thermoplasmata archaeon]|nr:mechanosensitive ion channel family protein [Thermoplasmata archaeon]
MAAPQESRPLRLLFRNLLLVVLLATGIYLLFSVFNATLLHRLTGLQILLLEAGAIVLLAYAVAKAFTGAANAVMRQQGQLAHGAAVRLFFNILIGIAAVFALAHLAGVSIESIFLGSAFAGIVLGLAAQTVLSNVFAGLLLVVASPFRPGDRVGIISSSYGAFAPSYPHELVYPAYAGTVEDIELIYTVLRLDTGGVAKVPNSVVLSALTVLPRPDVPRVHRVRMTFPLAVDVHRVEAALADVLAAFPDDAGRLPPKLEVTDISVASWDGVILVASRIQDDGLVRDRVMRAVLARLPSAGPPA